MLFRSVAEGEEEDEAKPRKRASGTGCSCKTGCKTKACSCKKAGPYCSAACKCNASKCINREDPGSDVSTNSTMDTDKENEMNESSEEGDTTDKLLNGTFEGPVGKLSFSNPSTPEIPRTPLGPAATSIFRTPNSGADMFAADSDVEATPKVHSEKNFFQTPSME